MYVRECCFGEGGELRARGLLGVLVPERWRGRVGTLKDESESDSARDDGVGLRIVNETFAGGADDENMAVQGRETLTALAVSKRETLMWASTAMDNKAKQPAAS